MRVLFVLETLPFFTIEIEAITSGTIAGQAIDARLVDKFSY